MLVQVINTFQGSIILQLEHIYRLKGFRRIVGFSAINQVNMLTCQAIVEIAHVRLVSGKADESKRGVRLHLSVLGLQVVGANHLFKQLQGIVVDADAVFVQIHCPDFMPTLVVEDAGAIDRPHKIFH